MKSNINNINELNEFQKIAEILIKIRETITNETDTVYVGYENAQSLIDELTNDINEIKLCNYEILEKTNINFAPTSRFQELSLSNGWSELYNKLSKEFDIKYKMLIGILKPHIFKNK